MHRHTKRAVLRVGLRVALVVAALVVGAAVLASLLASDDGVEREAARSVDAELAIERAHRGTAALIGKGEHVEAEAVARAAIDRWPGDQRLHLVLAESLIGQQRWGESLASMREAVRIGPDSAEYRFLMGTIAYKAGELEVSARQYALGQERAPGNPKHPLYRAQVQRVLGDIDGARRSLERVIELDADIAEAWAGLAGIALDGGDVRGALAHVARARVLDPDAPAYRVLESRALRGGGRPRDAAEVLIGAPHPNAASAREMLAELSRSLDEIDAAAEAARAYAEASERFPGDAELAYLSAVWHERAGEPEIALNAARRAVILGHEPARELAARLLSQR